MELAPIKIRGKRGQRTRSKNRVKVSRRSRKSRDGDCKDKCTLAANTTKIKSRLSRLPQEILERVFLLSQNLSLPRASRELYSKLTNDSVKYQLVGAAFGPTWDQWYGIDRSHVNSYHGWQHDGEHIDGDPIFQSAVLACSWAKTPVILEAYEIWNRQHVRDRPYHTHNPHEYSSPIPLSMKEKLTNELATFTSTTFRLFEAKQLWDASFKARASPLLTSGPLEVHPETLIPESLLSGPFDDGNASEKLQRLFWLVRGGARLQLDTQTWESTQQGFWEIVVLDVEGSIKSLVFLFMILGVFREQWPLYIVHQLDSIFKSNDASKYSGRKKLLKQLILDIKLDTAQSNERRIGRR